MKNTCAEYVCYAPESVWCIGLFFVCLLNVVQKLFQCFKWNLLHWKTTTSFCIAMGFWYMYRRVGDLKKHCFVKNILKWKQNKLKLHNNQPCVCLLLWACFRLGNTTTSNAGFPMIVINCVMSESKLEEKKDKYLEPIFQVIFVRDTA